jgi:uncharacterized protein DUF4184
MPFTLAHPAAILPLRGFRYLRTVPLIIGALIPDLPYYLPAHLARFTPETHSFEGSVTIDLLLGYAALAAVFVLRLPLTALLSARTRWLCLSALAPFSSRPLEWLFAAVAIVLGVWTHLLWDSFTHLDGWMVHRVAALSAPVTLGPYHGTVCHVLQYLSSVFGLAVMALWYGYRIVPAAAPAAPAAPASRQSARCASGPMLLLVVAAAGLIGGVQATEHYSHTPNIYRALTILLTHSLAWFALLYLVAGTIASLEQAHERVAGAGR